MLGSSKTGREYNQDQILLNSASIGIPLSLATSSTNTSNLLHPSSSLSLNTSNVLLATSPATITTPTSSTNNNSTQAILNTSLTQNQIQTSTSSTNNKNDISKNKNDEKDKKNNTDIVSDIALKNVSKTETEDFTFKFQDNTNTINNETSTSMSQNEEENKDKLENLPTSLFLGSSLSLNLDDTSDFLNGAIDMDIDLLNSSLANDLNSLNSLTVDINPISTTSADAITSSSSTTENTSTTTTTTSTNNKASSTSVKVEEVKQESTESSISNIKKEEVKSDGSSDKALTTSSSATTAVTSTTTETSGSNPLDPMLTDPTDKKDLLEFFNTEDFENNLKLFPFSNQSLLLPQQKDLAGVPLLSDQSLTDPSALSIISNPTTSTNTVVTNPETSSAISTTITTAATIATTDISTTTTAPNDPKATITTTVAAPAPSQSADPALALNPSLNMNTTAVASTDANAKAVAGIPPNPNELLTATDPNSLIGLPSMMNNATFFNLNADSNVANGIPGGPGTKVNYYPQPNPMVKPPQQNEVIMKKVYNGMVKPENGNDMQKNVQNRDVLKTQLSTGKINLKELNEANPNVKINMKSVKSGAPKGRRVQSRNASLRPTLSYVELITEAICDSEDGLLSLQEIYDAIKRKYVYFRTADPAWQNSIRHNLSVHQSFTKITRPPNRPGKGFLWTSSKIDYQNLSAESRKRRKREHNEKTHNMNQAPPTTKNQNYHANYPATTNAPMAQTNVPQQNMSNNMNDINYLLNQQQQQPRISQKVMKILTDSSINTPSLKQLLFTGFKHMSNEPYHSRNGLNYPMNSFDGYHGTAHSSSMYGGSQYLVNSSAYPTAQMANSSMPLSLNSLIMPTSNGSSALPASNTASAFATKGSSTFQNSFTNTTSNLPLTNMDSQKYSSGGSMYPSLLDPEYSFRYPSHSMFRSSYYYPTPKNDVMMHNTTRRYSFDSAMTSSAAFAAAAAAHNNANNPNNPTPPFFSLAKSQSAKNVATGPNYIKKDREKKIMYEKMHHDFNNIVNQPSVHYTGNTSNYMAGTTAAGAPLNYNHKHLPTNYSNNLSIQPPSYNTSNPIPNIQTTKPLTTPMIYDAKTEHSALDSTVISSAPAVIDNESSMIANKEQA